MVRRKGWSVIKPKRAIEPKTALNAPAVLERMPLELCERIFRLVAVLRRQEFRKPRAPKFIRATDLMTLSKR